MKITKIEKKKRLYLVELDDWDKLYVTEDTLVRFMLSKGLDIPENRLEEIKTFAQFSYGKNLALYYLSFKPRTEKEVQTYLIKHEIEETIIPQILTNLKADRWVDDRRLTQTILEQNLHSGDKGPYALRQKLQQKGIKKSLLDELLEEVDFSPVLDRLVQKLYRKYEGKLPLKALQQKMTQFLSTRGFTFQDIREAMEEIDWEKDEEEELELLERELDKQYRKYSRKYDGYQLKQRLTMALTRKGYDFDDIRSALRDYL